jgi:hypothetical protein
MSQQTLSARELYHLTRRAMTSARSYFPFEYVYDPVTGTSAQKPTGPKRWHVSHYDSKALAANEVRARLGVATLPRGMAPRVEASVRAVQRSRKPATSSTLQARLLARIADKVLDEAASRNLPTFLDLAKAGSLRLSVADAKRVDGRWTLLLHAEGWAQYSRAVGRYHASLSILGGFDDNGTWAVRVPGTLTTVAEGLAWLKPAAVRNAEEAGKRVLRQGDVWIVERVRDAMSDQDLPQGHRWDGESRTVRHGDHTPVHVPFAAIAIRQSTLAANGQGRRRGD